MCKTKNGSLEEHFCKIWMLFSWEISKTCLGQLETKTVILDFGTLQKVTTLLQKLFRTLRRTHLPCLVTSNKEGLRTKIKNVSINQSHGFSIVLKRNSTSWASLEEYFCKVWRLHMQQFWRSKKCLDQSEARAAMLDFKSL